MTRERGRKSLVADLQWSVKFGIVSTRKRPMMPRREQKPARKSHERALAKAAREDDYAAKLLAMKGSVADDVDL
jgi:hypothetical protein